MSRITTVTTRSSFLLSHVVVSSAAALALLVGGARVASAQAAPARAEGAAGSAVVVVPDTAAARYAGREVTVEGVVARVKPSRHRRTTFLDFGAAHPSHTFSVHVPDSALARVGGAPALAALAGERVRATGTVWMQDGKWPAVTVTQAGRLALAPELSSDEAVRRARDFVVRHPAAAKAVYLDSTHVEAVDSLWRVTFRRRALVMPAVLTVDVHRRTGAMRFPGDE